MLKVRKTQCKTCIYRPGLAWDLDRLDLVEFTDQEPTEPKEDAVEID